MEQRALKMEIISNVLVEKDTQENNAKVRTSNRHLKLIKEIITKQLVINLFRFSSRKQLEDLLLFIFSTGKGLGSTQE